MKVAIGMNNWNVETNRNKLEKTASKLPPSWPHKKPQRKLHSSQHQM